MSRYWLMIITFTIGATCFVIGESYLLMLLVGFDVTPISPETGEFCFGAQFPILVVSYNLAQGILKGKLK